MYDFSENKYPYLTGWTLKNAAPFGVGAIFYGIMGASSSYLGIYGIQDLYARGEGRFLFLLLLLHIISFLGLIIIGLFMVCRSRYVLIVLIPFSLIGLITIPYGTIFYIFFLRGLWRFIPLYFPFDRKQRLSNAGKSDDT
jgi:hypothetical protein